MSKPAVQVIIRGLKCDSEGCDFFDPDATVEDSLVGKPCPKCGANLLTEEDMAAVRFLQGAAHLVNVAHGPIADDAEYSLTRLRMNGTGEMDWDGK